MSDMNINEDWNKMIPTDIKHILRKLDKAGYEAYIVGGCVRDMILNKTPNNWHIITNATPEQMLEVFSNYKCVSFCKEHGSIFVMIECKPYRIDTYTNDGKYNGDYIDCTKHPQYYTSNLLEDLKHRDFTINAMAYRPESEVGLIDPFNGMEAIKSGVIHCVENPNNRFAEDGLRILRAIRFAAQLDFKIEKNTSLAMHKKKYLLDNVDKGRIESEIMKIISTKNQAILQEYADIVVQILPKIISIIT